MCNVFIIAFRKTEDNAAAMIVKVVMVATVAAVVVMVVAMHGGCGDGSGGEGEDQRGVILDGTVLSWFNHGVLMKRWRCGRNIKCV